MIKRKKRLSFAETCMRFQEMHPDLVPKVSYYMILHHSDAIEIHYKNGRMTVWDFNNNLEVTMIDGDE